MLTCESRSVRIFARVIGSSERFACLAYGGRSWSIPLTTNWQISHSSLSQFPENSKHVANFIRPPSVRFQRFLRSRQFDNGAFAILT